MSSILNVVAVSGSLQAPSKTTSLVHEIIRVLEATLEGAVQVRAHVIELAQDGRAFAGALTRDELPPAAEQQLRAIENADLLVVASPVYRASFTGLFKHVFDFVGQYALIDKPVLLAATGGSDRHALIIDHQFRPLFSFFQALTLPLGVYAKDSDFTDYRVSNPALDERIEQAISRGLPIIRARFVADADVSPYVGTW
ncbi:FMN reductase [Rathayibacter sp. YIM 133350]|uniref:FMN reductase n=1 Tax=Rathayibacter sp. YIM 133350 TaxID=3131992 RepID=UPI00307E48F8